MKTILRITCLSLLLFVVGCSKDDNEAPVTVKSGAKVLTSFVFNTVDNVALENAISAVINEANKTISISVPPGTDVSSLNPKISISDKASVSPRGAQNFSAPIAYMVTAEDESTTNYTATVIVLEIQNSAPMDFELISPTANGPNAGISLTPILTWNASEDPDGDLVTYDIYLNIGDSADELYAENITDTAYPVTQRFSLSESYTWRVVAKDPLGTMTSSSNGNFSTRGIRFNTIPLTMNAAFPERYLHRSIVFKDKMWVIGGNDSNNELLHDIWFSVDGKFWETTTTSAPFTQRLGHTLTVFDNKMWLIAGRGADNNYRNDVWSSEDGENWMRVAAISPFTARYGHTSVVFDSKMWVIGGFDANGDRQNDVWSSTDGILWNQENSAAPFNGRGHHTSVVFDGKIWVIAGGPSNNVWYSDDGANWSEATSAAPFTARSGHTSVVFDGKMWVIGGIDVQDAKKNDVWYTRDGTNWEEVNENAPFFGRMFHSSVVFNEKIWVIAGNGNLNGFIGNGEQLNDVWNFD